MAKKYVSLARLSDFLNKLSTKFSEIGHTHKLSEITDYKVDTALSSNSTNPVQNKVIDAEFDAIATAMNALETAIDGKADSTHNHTIANVTNLQSSLDAKVPTSRTVNGKALTGNITLSASDVGAAASSHTHDGYVNQNAFSNVKVGSTTVAADTTTDTLEIAAGTGISVTGDATNDKVTITNSGVRSIATGSANGTISVNTNGTSADVKVKGLGSAAYTASTAYDASGLAQTKADAALASAKSYTDGKISALLDGASDTTLDSIKELADAIKTNDSAIDALNTVAAGKANASDLTSHTGNKSNPHGVTLAQLGVTATAAEVNKMDGVTATTAEINILDGITATTAELNYVDGVTSNIQTQLDGKSNTGHTHNYAGSSSAGGAATSANKVNSSLTVKLNGGTTEGTNLFTFNGSAAKSVNITPSAIGASASSHTHDDRYYTETEIDSKLSGKANTSHGNHVPTTQTASNKVFLRNDNTWATVTPANIGAAASSHTHTVANITDLTATATELNYMDGVTSNVQTQLDGKAASSHDHSASNITSGTLSSDRLPTVPVAKGGTGATTAADALTNLGITATATELNYVDGVTSSIQTQLNNKAGKSNATVSAAGLMSATDKSKLNYSNIAYGTCSTAEDVQEKVITISGNTNWSMDVGSIIVIKFSYTNTSNTPKFNVNGTGAKGVLYNKTMLTTNNKHFGGTKDRPMFYMYNGTNYVFLGWSWIDTNQTLGNGFGQCTTAASTVAKSVSLNGYYLTMHGFVSVEFKYDVPANATMNINGTGAVPIYYRDLPITTGVIKAGDLATFSYSGAYFHLIAIDRWQDDIGQISQKASVATMSTAEYNALEESGEINANTLYMLTDAEDEEEVFITTDDIDAICGATI